MWSAHIHCVWWCAVRSADVDILMRFSRDFLQIDNNRHFARNARAISRTIVSLWMFRVANEGLFRRRKLHWP